VGDEVLTRAPALVGVALAGERERPFDRLGVDLLAAVCRVLGNDREEVAQQLALIRGELLGDLVDRRRGGSQLALPDARVAGVGLRPVLSYSSCLRLLRYRRPSSPRAR
jgi:hypothetical protein